VLELESRAIDPDEGFGALRIPETVQRIERLIILCAYETKPLGENND
jgi:hypothetical protein